MLVVVVAVIVLLVFRWFLAWPGLYTYIYLCLCISVGFWAVL